MRLVAPSMSPSTAYLRSISNSSVFSSPAFNLRYYITILIKAYIPTSAASMTAARMTMNATTTAILSSLSILSLLRLKPQLLRGVGGDWGHHISQMY